MSDRPCGRGIGLAAGGVVLAVGIVYANSLSAPFVFDDLNSVAQNPTIRHLWPLSEVLVPPASSGLAGRPLANLSFALNYALGGEAVWTYHAVNFVLHALAALVLMGVVHRTLLRLGWRERWGAVALPLAWTVALLWAVHPLQTEAVTYISQRTEVLMGFFYLLTLYGFIRGAESPAPRRWWALAIGACWLGAASKEVIVTAPVMVLLYDRTLVAGTWGEIRRKRWGFYLGLAGSWLLLGWLMRDLPARHVGFGQGVSSWAYALNQCRVIGQYLRLAVWPDPLVFDYGSALLPITAMTVVWASLLGLILVVTGVALAKRKAIGLVGAWVLLTLAPTSSVVPIVLQPMAEHRMYLPLAGVVLLVGLGLQVALGRRATLMTLGLAVGLGMLTVRRNEIYRSELALWTESVAQRPDNARAQTNLGTALARAGRVDEACAHFAVVVTLAPNDAGARYNLANSLLELNRPAEALVHAERAVRLEPGFVEGHSVLGGALMMLDRLDEAQTQFELALHLDPNYRLARQNLARIQAYRFKLLRH
ncbi:MAG: tetratricopeptide repeat protein [Opitutaceae bacterium]